MISRTVKLYPTKEQAATLTEWFSIGTGMWNWAHGQYLAGPRPCGPQMQSRWPTEFHLNNEISGHAKRIGFPSIVAYGITRDVHRAWREFREGGKGRPHRKGNRNRLASLAVSAPGRAEARTLGIPCLGRVKARGHRDVATAKIKFFRIHRRARGWYATLTIDAEPRPIPIVGDLPVGVDLGYSTLATLSTGEKIAHPRELHRAEVRIAQAARSLNRRLLGRLQQRLGNARRHRHHTMSRDLVSRFGAIYVSRDNLKGLQRTFGKSVLSAGHGELLTMLEVKCRQAGREYVEVPSRNSTKTCSACGRLDGPTGLRGLKVREWRCACGALHDRDINAARNTLALGAVLALESRCDPVSEISGHR